MEKKPELKIVNQFFSGFVEENLGNQTENGEIILKVRKSNWEGLNNFTLLSNFFEKNVEKSNQKLPILFPAAIFLEKVK